MLEIEQYRQQLLKMREEIEALADEAADATRPVELDQSSFGRLSRMDAMQAQQMASETVRRRRQKLQHIEGALRRLDSGDFGYCYVCGEPIDAPRLAFDPTATRCLGCVEA